MQTCTNKHGCVCSAETSSFLSSHHFWRTEGKFLVTKIEFGESFGMILEGDRQDVESLLMTFGMNLQGVWHEL
jgi:hypothetical protein